MGPAALGFAQAAGIVEQFERAPAVLEAGPSIVDQQGEIATGAGILRRALWREQGYRPLVITRNADTVTIQHTEIVAGMLVAAVAGLAE